MPRTRPPARVSPSAPRRASPRAASAGRPRTGRGNREGAAGSKGDLDLIAGDEALAALAHELRTPLHAIRASAELILAGDAGPIGDDVLTLVGGIASAAQRLELLVGLLVIGAACDERPAEAVELLELLHAERVRLDPALPQARLDADRALLAALLAVLRQSMIGDDPSAQITARALADGVRHAGVRLERVPAAAEVADLAAICGWADRCLGRAGIRVCHLELGTVALSWEAGGARR